MRWWSNSAEMQAGCEQGEGGVPGMGRAAERQSFDYEVILGNAGGEEEGGASDGKDQVGNGS
jgi:hypothetical protein